MVKSKSPIAIERPEKSLNQTSISPMVLSSKTNNTEIYNKIINIKKNIIDSKSNSESQTPISPGPIRKMTKDSLDSNKDSSTNISGLDQFNKNNKLLMTTVKDLKNRLQKSNNQSNTKATENISHLSNSMNEKSDTRDNQQKLKEIRNKILFASKMTSNMANTFTIGNKTK